MASLSNEYEVLKGRYGALEQQERDTHQQCAALHEKLQQVQRELNSARESFSQSRQELELTHKEKVALNTMFHCRLTCCKSQMGQECREYQLTVTALRSEVAGKDKLIDHQVRRVQQ